MIAGVSGRSAAYHAGPIPVRMAASSAGSKAIDAYRTLRCGLMVEDNNDFIRGVGDLPAKAFRMIVDGSATPFVVMASDGTIHYAGGSIERALGRPPEEVAGHNMVEFLPEEE